MVLFAVSAYPADLFSGSSSLGFGYQLGAAAAAAAAAASPWRQLYVPASPVPAEHRYRHSPLQSTVVAHQHHHQQQQQRQSLWSPTSAFSHPAAAAAAAAGLTEGAMHASPRTSSDDLKMFNYRGRPLTWCLMVRTTIRWPPFDCLSKVIKVTVT